AVREVVENSVLYRDSGDWERFASVWHPDGWMSTTWFQGPADEYIAASRAGCASGSHILHLLGAHTCDLVDDRAIGQTKTQILQRGSFDGVLVDVTCTGRFFDFLGRRDGRWALVRRQTIYEQDRIDPVTPGVRLELDPALLARFPAGYRHLAYLQEKLGYRVPTDLPERDGPAVTRLYQEGVDWLAGSTFPGAIYD
ncbi:MAG TPA: nuclear transport factor 2 family protein, partial [Pseudonocardiaceae bacterium]